MEIGKLNQRITILEHRTVTDEIGNHITKWEENFSLWASVTSKSVTETTDAGVTKEVQLSVFFSETIFMISQELHLITTTTAI